jgi:hypothetical protein
MLKHLGKRHRNLPCWVLPPRSSSSSAATDASADISAPISLRIRPLYPNPPATFSSALSQLRQTYTANLHGLLPCLPTYTNSGLSLSLSLQLCGGFLLRQLMPHPNRKRAISSKAQAVPFFFDLMRLPRFVCARQLVHSLLRSQVFGLLSDQDYHVSSTSARLERDFLLSSFSILLSLSSSPTFLSVSPLLFCYFVCFGGSSRVLSRSLSSL